jgi:hypothetical protein
MRLAIGEILRVVLRVGAGRDTVALISRDGIDPSEESFEFRQNRPRQRIGLTGGNVGVEIDSRYPTQRHVWLRLPSAKVDCGLRKTCRIMARSGLVSCYPLHRLAYAPARQRARVKVLKDLLTADRVDTPITSGKRLELHGLGEFGAR